MRTCEMILTKKGRMGDGIWMSGNVEKGTSRRKRLAKIEKKAGCMLALSVSMQNVATWPGKQVSPYSC